MQKPNITIKFSRQYFWFLLSVHFAALLALWLSDISIIFKALGSLFIFYSGYRIPSVICPVQFLRLIEEDIWQLSIKNKTYMAKCSGFSWVSPWVSILLFQISSTQQKIPVVLCSDSVSTPKILKELSVFLRMMGRN